MGDGDIEGKSKIAVSGRESVYLEVFFGLENVDGGTWSRFTFKVRPPRSVDRDEPQLSKMYGLSNKHMYDFVRQIKRNTNDIDIDIIETTGLHQDKRQECQTTDGPRSEEQRKHKTNMNKRKCQKIRTINNELKTAIRRGNESGHDGFIDIIKRVKVKMENGKQKRSD